MIANHIHHALAQVQELQHKILEKQRFKGYSGRARAISGTLALLAAFVMDSRFYPKTVAAHATGWGTVFVFSVLLNFGAVLYWFLFNPSSKREVRRLKPVVDVFFPLVVGGLLTLALLREDLPQYLFGTWMCLFGLANLATRHVLPRAIWLIGLYYILFGAALLLILPVSFLNPWPMGIAFFIGEWCGGIVLHFDETEHFSLMEFLGRKKHAEI
jgi:hypothetical protein